MSSIGSRKSPAIVRVQTPERAQQVIDLCNEQGIHCVAGVEPGKPEDISDIDRAFQARQLAQPSAPKAGRNDPCPCGSGKKFKKCCAGHVPTNAK